MMTTSAAERVRVIRPRQTYVGRDQDGIVLLPELDAAIASR